MNVLITYLINLIRKSLFRLLSFETLGRILHLISGWPSLFDTINELENCALIGSLIEDQE